MRSRVTARAAAAICATVIGITAPSVRAQNTERPTQRVVIKWRQSGAYAGVSRVRTMSDAQARMGVAMTSVRTLPTGAEVIRMDRQLSGSELQNVIATMSRDPAVEYVHEDLLLKPFSAPADVSSSQHGQVLEGGNVTNIGAPVPIVYTPNDTQYNQQWHYFENNAGLIAPYAWDYTIGSGVRVAVVDTGYRPHPDLAPNILGGYDFISDPFIANDGNSGRDSSALDPGDFVSAGTCAPGDPGMNSSWHGTHVAGTIAAVTGNNTGVAGIAFGAKVVPVRVLGRCGGLLSDVAEGIVWAAGGSIAGVPANPYPAKVITLALGVQAPCDATSQAVIDTARSLGAIVVVAAGNSNIDAASTLPANCSGVITVGAVARDGSKASYSNFGAVVDVAAPGGDMRSSMANGVLSTFNSGTTTPGSDTYGYKQGTSMAAANVAGVVALMLSVNNLAPDDLENILKVSTRAFPGTCSKCGTGIINAAAAVTNAINDGTLR